VDFVGQRPMVVSLARVLIDAGLTDTTWLGRATAIANEADVPMVHALTRWRLLDAQSLASALAAATGLPVIDLSGVRGPLPVNMSRTACHRLRVLPLLVADGVLTLAMSDPTDEDICAEVEEGVHLRVHRVLVNDDDLETSLRRVFARPGDERRLTGLNALPTTPSRPQPFTGVGAVLAPTTSRLHTPPTLTAAAPVGRAPPPPMPAVPPLPTPFAPQPHTPSPFDLVEETPTGGGDDQVAGVFSTVEPTAIVGTGESDTGVVERGIASLMSVCIVLEDEQLGDEIAQRLTRTVGSLAVFTVDRALLEVGRRHFNMVVAVLPTVTTTIALGLRRLGLLLDQNRGLTVVSNVAGVEIVPGVETVVRHPPRDQVVETLQALILRRARGEMP
jgi:hypothetical protein